MSAPLGREGAHGAPGVLAGSVDDLVKAWVSSLIPLGTTLHDYLAIINLFLTMA